MTDKEIIQQAITLLEPLREDEFMQKEFSNRKNRCCVIGHIQRLTSDNPNDYSRPNCNDDAGSFSVNTFGFYFRRACSKAGSCDIAAVNNHAPAGRIKETVLKELRRLVG